MIDVESPYGKLHILPIVKGLKSEAEKVESTLKGYTGTVAISMGAEEVNAVRHAEDQEWDYDPSDLEAVYAYHLKNYGEVTVPVPAYLAAVRIRDDIVPLDMDDAEYTEVYCDCVGVGDLLKEKKVAKKGMKHTFQSADADSFAKEWDEFVCTVNGFKAVALRREEYMAKNIDSLLKARGELLVIAETERVDGIIFELRMLWNP